ncbi:MAG: 30S ribosomal protein S18 [Candidatus Amesbacteria bacterium GW2011_GWA1_47_16]|uniref:Small ribosomal subunit protein bS18 n=2 Tax=Candidatus Amesiibacteriota TaxID=1752730 RepID=A0A0G1S3A6_9BACT|nr:MAG: 30S ribosomal protein S18 [Candidatus Amesbacteria bacterium GW2011_GWA1_47_16]KKU63872.1 MAG: 30S ribosomal protein S18 [Candidatus Amesbacteria bacterium GW2011_GWC1_47_15]
MAPRKPIRKRRIRVIKDCMFCKEKTLPSFKDVATLSRFVSERGRILSRDRTGICAKHQRIIAQEIKRARHLALLPFVAGL